MAHVDGTWVAFPTHAELERATFDMVVAGRVLDDGDVAIMMVEAEATVNTLKLVADGVRPFVPARYRTLGTDGFGRSDYRRRLRSFFEVDRRHVALAALKSLADDQLLPSKTVAEALKRYEIDPERASPALS